MGGDDLGVGQLPAGVTVGLILDFIPVGELGLGARPEKIIVSADLGFDAEVFPGLLAGLPCAGAGVEDGEGCEAEPLDEAAGLRLLLRAVGRLGEVLRAKAGTGEVG